MTEFGAVLAEVWSVATLVDALLGGLVVGFLIVQMSKIPDADSASGLALLVMAAASLFVVVFWAGQIADALLTADHNWPRALARSLLQLVYGVFTGIGFYIGVRIQRSVRR
jgi:hypothetical protein